MNENPFWKERELQREITLGTDGQSLSRLVDFISAYAWEAGFENERIEDIRRASFEVLTNISENAYDGKEGEISVECSITDVGALIVTITYYGNPYNLLLQDIYPDPAEKGEKQSESVRLIKKLIGNVEYRRDAFRNIIILTLLKPLA